MAPPWPLQVVALTAVSCGSVLWSRSGAHGVTVVVKATFGLVHGAPARLVAPAELVREDRLRAGTQSLEASSDLAPYLPSAGVILCGHAHAPAGRPTSMLSVRLAIYRDRPLLEKTLHIFGNRAPGGANLPLPFKDVPIVYERAWGGPGVEENPAGTGAAPGSSLPNIVDPADPHKLAGFGPIARRWASRKRLLGAVDPASIERPIAEIPQGLDWRYFHAAPADQQIEPLRGDEWIVLDGMHRDLPRMQSRLPSPRAEARYFLGGQLQPVDLCADTLLIDADARTASVVWRGHVLLDRLGAPGGDVWSTLARMRAFAGVAMPGYPILWPKPGDPALTVPARAAAEDEAEDDMAPTIMEPVDRKKLPTLPFRPAAEGEPPRSSAMPNVETDVAPTITERIDRERLPVLPFRPAAEGEQPRFEPPRLSPVPAGFGSTTVGAVSPFASADVLPFRSATAPRASEVAAAPPPRTEVRAPAGEDATQAIDISALTGTASQVAPFAITSPGARAEGPRAEIPGSPWSHAAASEPAVPALVAPPPAAPAPVAAASTSPWVPTMPAFMTPRPQSAPAMITAPEPPAPVVQGPPLVAAPPAPPEPPKVVAPLEPPKAGGAAKSVRDKVVAALAGGEPLDGLNLAGADLSELDLHGQVLAGMNLRGANLARCNFTKASLAGAQLADAELSGAVLAGADLSKADLSRARGAGASFDGAKLGSAVGEGADLTGASFAGAEAEGSRWERATLTGSKWTAARLKGASMARATVERADFSEADLTGATLSRMTGAGVVFAGAVLERADLRRATLPEASLVDTRFSKGSADKVDLSGGRLMRADLRGTTLRGAILKGAVLARALLDGADLRDADLERANLFQADRKNAKTTGAKLDNIVDVDPDAR